MTDTYKCSTCGKVHEEVPLSFAADFPDVHANMKWEDRDVRAVIGTDQCQSRRGHRDPPTSCLHTRPENQQQNLKAPLRALCRRSSTCTYRSWTNFASEWMRIALSQYHPLIAHPPSHPLAVEIFQKGNRVLPAYSCQLFETGYIELGGGLFLCSQILAQIGERGVVKH